MARSVLGDCFGTQGCSTKCFIIEDLGDFAFHERFERLELCMALTFSKAEAETFVKIKLDKIKHRASKTSKHPEKLRSISISSSFVLRRSLTLV